MGCPASCQLAVGVVENEWLANEGCRQSGRLPDIAELISSIDRKSFVSLKWPLDASVTTY